MRVKERLWLSGGNRLLSVTTLVLSCFIAAECSCTGLSSDGEQSPGASSGTASLRAVDLALRDGSAALQRHDFKTAEFQFAKVVRLSPEIAAGHSAYGSALLALGRLQDATHELETAHRIDPAEPSAMLNLAYAYEQGGKTQNALAMYDSLAGSPGQMPSEAYVRNAALLVASGELPKATERIEQGARAFPQSGTLQDALGVLFTRQQNYVSAESAFRRAVLLEPGSGKAHMHLGSLFMLLKQHADAMSELTLAAKLSPSDAGAHSELGRELSLVGDQTAAIDELQKAHALAPSNIDTTYALAVAMQKAGRHQEALPFFEEAVSAHENDVGMLTNLGLDLVQLGRAKEGLKVYERALPLHASDWVLQQNVGVAYLQQNDLDHAVEHFKSALVVSPDNAQLHYDLGLAYKLKDKLPDAVAVLRKAQDEDSSLSDAPYTLGILFMQSGQFAEAQGELQKATVLMPTSGDAWSELADVEKSLNDFDHAIEDYKRAIRLRPDDAGNHINLAAILAQQGKHSEALAERKLAAALTSTLVNTQKATFAVGSAKTLLQQGKIDEAISQLRSALVAQPDNAEAHIVMAEALNRQGRSADAALELQQVHTTEVH